MKIYKDLRILSLDDDPMVRQMVEKSLLEIGFIKDNLVSAVNGKDGIEKARKAAQNGQPFEFIMTDMVMPKMSGLDFLEALQKISEYAEVPKLILSSQEEKAVIMQALKLGAHNYIVKPVQPKILAKKMIKTFQKASGKE